MVLLIMVDASMGPMAARIDCFVEVGSHAIYNITWLVSLIRGGGSSGRRHRLRWMTSV